jgi:hypothetical protein
MTMMAGVDGRRGWPGGLNPAWKAVLYDIGDAPQTVPQTAPETTTACCLTQYPEDQKRRALVGTRLFSVQLLAVR